MKKDIIVILKNKNDQLIIQKIIDSFDIPLNIIYGLNSEKLCKFLENYFIPFILVEANTELEYLQIVNNIRSVDKNIVLIIYYNNSNNKLSNYFNDTLNYIFYSTDSHYDIANTFFRILGKQIETAYVDTIQKKVKQAIFLSLSSQESIIANLLLHGYTATEISNKQGMSISTVVIIKAKVFEKFHVKTIIEFRILFKDTQKIVFD